MVKKDKIIRRLAKEYNKDIRIIEQIVNSPLKFTNRVIQDPLDDRPVRIRYFGVFVQKESYNKKKMTEDRIRILTDNIDDVTIVMASILGFTITSHKGAQRIIDEIKETKDYDKLKLIWDAYKEYEK